MAFGFWERMREVCRGRNACEELKDVEFSEESKAGRAFADKGFNDCSILLYTAVRPYCDDCEGARLCKDLTYCLETAVVPRLVTIMLCC